MIIDQTIKNGGVAALREQASTRVEQEFHSRQEQAQLEKVQPQQQKTQQRPQQSRGHERLGGRGKIGL